MLSWYVKENSFIVSRNHLNIYYFSFHLSAIGSHYTLFAKLKVGFKNGFHDTVTFIFETDDNRTYTLTFDVTL